ncbi:large ribosomal subunit protein P2-like [Lycium ferocissimum]|uniref:large ribosomal subunit protein P2-like n=1 Tax=Lycium ferocissimum TaxID=112874 RepID=UPI0028153BA1|nr:large ribosomal subunit protein P2-like [Lycium ferocissimum]
MTIIATYLLAALGGNASLMTKDLKAILASIGAKADEAKIELLLSQVKGTDLIELIVSSREMIAPVPSGGGVAAVASSGGSEWWPKSMRKRKKGLKRSFVSISLVR